MRWAGTLLAALFLAPALAAQTPGSGTPPVPETRIGEPTTLEVARADLHRLTACRSPAHADAIGLQRLRSLYILAVADEDELERAEEEATQLAGSERDPGGAIDPALVRAYQGALTVLQAKHGFWPVGRVRDLRVGLAELDREVEAHPEHLEIRYLRLVSTAFLPSLLGRSPGARSDLDAVVRLLPGGVGALPSRVVQAMGDTLLELLPAEDARREEVRTALELDRTHPVPLAPGCPG